MKTPAQRHFQRAAAAKQAGVVSTGKTQTGEQFELMSAALWEARRTLKTIKSIEGKIAKKRELLPQFGPYIQGVLEGGNGAQDDVLMTVMVWCFDIGALDTGLHIAEYAIKHSLQTPDRYERDTASLVVEQVADEALRHLDAVTDEDQRPTVAIALLNQLQRVEQLTADADMHDQIRAKLYKAMGYAWRDKQGHIEDALACLNRALQLNDRVGVKKDIEKLERELKKEPPKTGPEQPNAGNSQS